MNHSDLETLGFYEPGFLHLRVNTDLEISDLNSISRADPRLFSTFLHEYIHFIQNISTTSGLLDSILFIDFIKDVNWKIRTDGYPTFKVPVALTAANNIKPNFDLSKIYRGDANGVNQVIYQGYHTEDVIVVDKESKSIIAKKFIVHYVDTNNRTPGRLHFGSTCLKEYIAHTIQREYLPTVKHPDIPYLLAEQIVLKECPSFGSDPSLIASLCDASLMCLHPAQIFFASLERIKRDKFVPTNLESVTRIVHDGLTFQGQGKVESIESLFINSINLVDQQFFDALQSPQLLPNYNWIHHILNQGRWLRLNRPNFISGLVQAEGVLSQEFYDIVHRLGTPFFTNNQNKGSFIPPEKFSDPAIQPYQALVFKEIIRVFNGKFDCQMFHFCKSRPDKDITNSKCQTSPWERATEPELCPFGQLWKTWGLVGETPVP
ncbi:MAG TPA: hypothetical protein VK462_01240 [Nitrososphaeraceae archaeon]|nr:hypothetical protein [Nitrososphaeraceae archaeon]